MSGAENGSGTLLTGENPELRHFVDDVHEMVRSISDEKELTRRIADRLRSLLAEGLSLPKATTQAHPDRYVMYPLYVAEEGSFSIASAVWNVGQSTPVHGHETWGVVGIYSGVERELRYQKPTAADVPLVPLGEEDWSAGAVTVCCTSDDDVHRVSCGSAEPCVGIHVYGADIGTLQRRSYVPETGAVSWFVSTWAVTDQP